MKKIFLKVTLLLTLTVVLAGCTATQYLKTGVERVCDAGPAERAVLRLKVDQVVAPHQLRLQCAGEIEFNQLGWEISDE
jgi:hypothetical protein